ncbi:hypothetical protein Dimus_034230 [Dionaea muscipula]
MVKHEVLDHEIISEPVDQNHGLLLSVFGGNCSATSSFSASRSQQPTSVYSPRHIARPSQHELVKLTSSPAGPPIHNIALDHGMPSMRCIESSRAVNGKERNPLINTFNNKPAASVAGLKRMRTNEGNADSISNKFQFQNETFGHPMHGLVQHLSSIQMAAMEKLLLLQHSVPVRVRAKRGCATHPRSIAERMRRMRISERIRRLQELFPNMDKTNIADMLDVAAEYIKELQNQIKALSETQATCTCSDKQSQ